MQRLAVVVRVVAHLLVIARAELVKATVRDRDALELLVHQLLALLEQLLRAKRPTTFKITCIPQVLSDNSHKKEKSLERKYSNSNAENGVRVSRSLCPQE